MSSDLEKTVVMIAATLDRHGIPYMLIGGYAVGIHGAPRFTQDIDLTLGLDVDDFDRVADAIADDFTPLPENPRDFATQTNVLPIKTKADAIRVDLIFSFIEFERRSIEAADTINIQEYPVKVASPSHLIVYKLLAGRPRDLEDAENLLLCHHRTLNIEFIRRTLDELAPLANPDAISNWIKISSSISVN